MELDLYKILIVALALLTSACASSGTQVKDSALTQFQKGVTTEAEVVEALGPPQSMSTFSGGLILTYVGSHVQTKAATFIPIVGAFAGGASVHMSVVTFRFGPGGKLVDYSSTQSSTGTANGIAAGYQPPAPDPKVVE